MRASTVRSLALAVGCALLVAWTPAPVSAATCDAICTTPDLWGYGSEAIGFASCKCEGDTPGARVGPNCGCGECYQKIGAKITGFVKDNGACKSGSVDCGNCDVAPDSSANTTTAPPTTVPPSTAPANSSGSNSSSSSTTTSSDDGLATWQIALIICSCVLVIAVVMMTITSCYCKARNSMKENMQNEDERHEYEGYWNPNGGGDDRHNEQLAQSAFGATTTQGGRSSFTSTHSRPNSTKNVPYSEPTYISDDRIGGPGRSGARPSLGSTADLPGVYQPFPQRPAHDVGSRNNIAIEL